MSPSRLRSRFARAGLFALGMITTISLASFGSDEHWDDKNDPENMGYLLPDMDYRFDRLPMSGELRDLPWSDTYWPAMHGGLAWRWQVANGSYNFSYQPYGWGALQRMSSYDLGRSLSPIEKLEAVLGDKFHNHLNAERRRTGGRAGDDWAGICNGWAMASVTYEQPGAIMVPSADGTFDVPFTASDVKALLSWSYALGMDEDKRLGRRLGSSMGGRCIGMDNLDAPRRGNEDPNESSAARYARRLKSCQDVNAGAFHLVLANYLGRHQRPFLADMDNTEAIWNHPIVGYRSEIFDERRAPGYNETDGNGENRYKTLTSQKVDPRTKRAVYVKTTVKYVVEANPNVNPISSVTKEATYKYVVELDGITANSRVVGGEWFSDARPDMAWILEPRALPAELSFLRAYVRTRE